MNAPHRDALEVEGSEIACLNPPEAGRYAKSASGALW
ncbi:MAG: hypothetical protein JWP19_1600 [Rhodoglobus sp.]|nr:hypothetical protein [Rhodoglobus sp.]